MADQVSTQQAPTPAVESPQGPSKWIGRVVALAFLVMAVVVGMAMFASNGGSSGSPADSSGATQSAPAPSSDDDAIRKSLGK